MTQGYPGRCDFNLYNILELDLILIVATRKQCALMAKWTSKNLAEKAATSYYIMSQ